MAPQRIFLSHTATDKPFIEWLAIALRAHGIEVWFDKWDIKVGDSIVSKINDGLHASDNLLVALSTASVDSDWVKEELNAAQMRQLCDKKIRVLPALIEPCDVPPLLAHHRYADFTKSYAAGLSDLLDTLLPIETFRTELMALRKQFSLLKPRILAGNNDRTHPLDDRRMHHLRELYEVMDRASSVRLRLERKSANATDLTDRPEDYDLFKRLEFLQPDLGARLQSDAWAQLVMFRNCYMHEWVAIVDRNPEWCVFGEDKLDELGAVLETLCDAETEA